MIIKGNVVALGPIESVTNSVGIAAKYRNLTIKTTEGDVLLLKLWNEDLNLQLPAVGSEVDVWLNVRIMASITKGFVRHDLRLIKAGFTEAEVQY